MPSRELWDILYGDYMKEGYQELNLRELIVAILKKWWLIAILTLLAGGGSYWYNSATTIPYYQASATLFIGKDPSATANISINDLYLGQQLVNDYREILRSRQVSEVVQNNIDFDIPIYLLRGNLDAFLVEESRIMYITYTATSPEVAMVVANEFADVLAVKADEIVGVKNISVIDYAIMPMAAINQSFALDVLLAGLLGGSLGILLGVVFFVFDNTIKKDTDLEKLVGLPIIAEIPDFRKGEAYGR